MSNMMKRFVASFNAIFCIIGCFCPSIIVYAKETPVPIKGDIYEFAGKDHYEFSLAVASDDANAFGTFTISGDMENTGNTDGIPEYSVSFGGIISGCR